MKKLNEIFHKVVTAPLTSIMPDWALNDFGKQMKQEYKEQHQEPK